MQEPLDNLSDDARTVYDFLAANGGRNWQPEEISEGLGGELRPGEVADALRELDGARRADEAMGGWSILT
ncbi:hypothetical protein OJ997_01840 [Solirubrobacter phytolaccae]|uniref:Uncharacterized protein n=1 Tax=Solirubrobacter phytolaccae TaxID=1404360 RepID=A0A9X3N391_9ACTN|nr:hypothetical protein [Solirubrobacter phytolaccae]MDA0179020.1 hypothetical protein [Solirubrobacter phytolaccae]